MLAPECSISLNFERKWYEAGCGRCEGDQLSVVQKHCSCCLSIHAHV